MGIVCMSKLQDSARDSQACQPCSPPGLILKQHLRKKVISVRIGVFMKARCYSCAYVIDYFSFSDTVS